MQGSLHSVKWHNLESFYPIKNNFDTWFPLDDNESFFLSSLYSDCDKILLIGNLTSKPLHSDYTYGADIHRALFWRMNFAMCRHKRH